MWTVLNIVLQSCSLTCLLSLPLSQCWSMFTIHPDEQQTSTEDSLLLPILQTCATQPKKGTLLLFCVLSGTDVVGSLWSLSGHGATTQADNHGLSTIQLFHYPAPVLVICCLILSVCMQYISHQVVTTFAWASVIKHYRICQTMLKNQNLKSPVEGSEDINGEIRLTQADSLLHPG